jgi:membrane protein implicated in regulation of membrane protease activity
MTDWIIWFVLAGVLVILEMFTGTFYLLMIGLGLLAGGLAALAGASIAIQFILAAAVGAAVTFALRRSKLGRTHKADAARDPNINLDIGQTVAVEEWKSIPGGMCTARVMYRGAMWDIELAQGEAAQPGSFVIREVRGNRLIVANSGSTGHSK